MHLNKTSQRSIMKTLMIITLSFISHTGYSQIMLGYTVQDVLKQIPKLQHKSNGKEVYLSYETEKYEWIYYFEDENKTCEMNMVISKTNSWLSTMIEEYNKNAVRISTTKWDYYLQGSVVRIDLDYNKEKDQYTFFYYKRHD